MIQRPGSALPLNHLSQVMPYLSQVKHHIAEISIPVVPYLNSQPGEF